MIPSEIVLVYERCLIFQICIKFWRCNFAFKISSLLWSVHRVVLPILSLWVYPIIIIQKNSLWKFLWVLFCLWWWAGVCWVPTTNLTEEVVDFYSILFNLSNCKVLETRAWSRSLNLECWYLQIPTL